MYFKFLSLDKDKQHKIINAAIKVFSNTSYKKASTDDIIREANISKGALFHYFKNKKNLYLYLYDYSSNVLLKEFYEKIDLSEKDILERFKNIIVTKLNLMNKYPNMFTFMVNAVYDENMSNELKTRNEKVAAENYTIILEGIDKNKFREDINPDIAINMIFLTFEAFANREAIKMKNNGLNTNLQEIWLNEINQYVDIMKKIYYKGV